MVIAYILDAYPSLSETFIAREIAALRRRGLTVHVFALRAGEGAHPIAPLLRWTRSSQAATRRSRFGDAPEAMLRHGAKTFYYRRLGAAWWRAVQNGDFDHLLRVPASDDGETARDDGETTRDDAMKTLSAWRIEHIHAAFASHPADIAWGAARASGLTWSFSGHARDLFVEGGALQSKLRAARFATVCTRAGERHLHRALESPARNGSQGEAKIIYAPHGLEIACFRFRDRFARRNAPVRAHEYSCGTILSVGRLVEKKGFSVLLNALALLRDETAAPEADGETVQRPRLKATIVGEGPQREALERQIARLGLSDVVRLAGALSHDQVMQAMREADCLVVPSRTARDGDRDGLPNVVLEAAACGLPLVAARAGGLPDFLDDTTGVLCASGDARSLARAIRRVFDEPESTRRRSRAARQRVIKDFDIDRNIEPLLQAFAAASVRGCERSTRASVQRVQAPDAR